MKARLFARYGSERGREVEFGREATIGRGRENTLALGSPEVSQRHARVVFDDETGAYHLEDLDSLNGTRLDGVPVRGRERLGGLHVLGFGGAAEFFFVELERDPEEPEIATGPVGGKTRIDAEVPAVPASLEKPPAGTRTRVDAEVPALPDGLREEPPAADAPGTKTRVEEAPADLPASLAARQAAEEAEPPAPGTRFVLEVRGASPSRYPLRPGENLVGRAGRAAVRLRRRELSRRHATLRVEGDRVWVRDEGSRNHTFVAGDKIGGEVELGPGAELRFGTLEARLLLDEPGGNGDG